MSAKDRPILMSAPMVLASLASTKRQTRRALRVQPPSDVLDFCTFHNPDGEGLAHFGFDPLEQALQEWYAVCPYGQVGDRLNVRETFFAWGRWETRFSAKKGRDEWHFVDMTLEAGKSYAYAADGLPAGYAKHHGGRGGITPTWWKRPAIFMPRAACRITLEVTDVRVERLQDISEADAQAEGIERLPAPVIDGGWSGPNRFTLKGMGAGACAGLVSWNAPTATELYQRLWTEINGPESWDANPWVWAVSFRRVEAAA